MLAPCCQNVATYTCHKKIMFRHICIKHVGPLLAFAYSINHATLLARPPLLLAPLKVPQKLANGWAKSQ